MKKLQLLNFSLFNIFEENPHINSFPFPTQKKLKLWSIELEKNNFFEETFLEKKTKSVSPKCSGPTRIIVSEILLANRLSKKGAFFNISLMNIFLQ